MWNRLKAEAEEENAKDAALEAKNQTTDKSGYPINEKKRKRLDDDDDDEENVVHVPKKRGRPRGSRNIPKPTVTSPDVLSKHEEMDNRNPTIEVETDDEDAII